ncbi:MAG: peptidylprolyl isomerase [Chromatiales bacterium]|jgi:peptidyl-prolyl cis-trans isomerase SurA|nr:peptidylprolyl isomerase [Chromatiales bacterium]
MLQHQQPRPACSRLHITGLHCLPALLASLVLAQLPVSGAVAQTRELSSSGELLDGIAAIVNDGVVLKSELQLETRRIVERLKAQNTQLPPNDVLVRQVLDRLIIQQLQLQRADNVGIKISDETLNLALANIAERNNVSLADLPGLLAREGVDYAAYRRDLRQQITIDQLRQRDVLQRIAVSPREVDAFLARQEGKSNLREDFLVSHILIPVSSTAQPAEIETAQKLADELHARILAGENFAKLALTYSSGQQALEGGSLGWLKGSELPSIFADVAPGLPRGGVSEPIRNASGFHLIRLDDRRGGEPIMEDQTHARHILMTTNEVQDDDAVRQKLLEIRQRILAGEDFSAVAKVVSEDPQSAVEGGDLGWTGPGNFVPEFDKTMNALQLDQISEPFKTQFGWHILQVLERRVYDATADRQRQEAVLAIRNSKLGDEAELWTRRLRDEAFVEIRI